MLSSLFARHRAGALFRGAPKHTFHDVASTSSGMLRLACCGTDLCTSLPLGLDRVSNKCFNPVQKTMDLWTTSCLCLRLSVGSLQSGR